MKKFNVPRKIKIGGHEIKVIYKNKIFEQKEECFGVADKENNVIYLAKGMEKTRKMEIILHESIHIMEGLYDFSLTEKEVTLLAVGLLALLRENKMDFTS